MHAAQDRSCHNRVQHLPRWDVSHRVADFRKALRVTNSRLADFQHHPDQVRKRGRLHLLHHARAMNFDSALAQFQIARNDFIRFAMHY